MILYIDTSSSYLYTGIVSNNKIICEIKKEYGHTLSEFALPEIVSMFEQNKIKPEEIKEIIVVNGPGSFTGIRIGVTIAKVYAWSLNIKIKVVTALEAMMISSKKEIVKIPIINARRGFVFGAIYDENNNELLKPKHIKLSELQMKIPTKTNYTYITNDEFEELEEVEAYEPNILKIVQYCEKKEALNPHFVNPEYLKLTEAEESKK